MANAYLNIAERVLSSIRRPLTPAEIVDLAYSEDLVPMHLHGSTQHKTMHARLSEHVSRYLDESPFFRTGPGMFFLRRFISDPSIPQAYKTEFHAPPRRKELKREAILAVQIAELPDSDSSRVSVADLKKNLLAGKFKYSLWKELRSSKEYLPVYSFLVVHRSAEVLSYRCGKFTPHSDPLFGTRSVGFGGPVLASDLDLLFDSFFGIIGNAVNEIVYALGLPRRLAEEARYNDLVRPHFGVVTNLKHGAPRSLHVVQSYQCPDDFTPTKAALSLNDLRWISRRAPSNRIEDYDQLSQLLFEQNWLREMLPEA